MARKKGVSSRTHTKQQLDDYANQNNPNNKAYKARVENDKMTKRMTSNRNSNHSAKKQAKLENEIGCPYPNAWMYYGNPYDFD